MRSLHQPQQRCTAGQHAWHRSPVAQSRFRPLRQSVTASAVKININVPNVDAAPQQPPKVFQLPKTARPLQSVLDAQASAEATQRELLAKGPLADAAAAGNKLVASILSTYSTVQQLYHKAVLPFVMRYPQYIDCTAGMAYAVCHDILKPNRAPAVQPGGSITEVGLEMIVNAATPAAVASSQQANVLFAGVLSALASCEAKGDWHVLPDLVTMLTSDWFVRGTSSSDSSKGWLPALGNALGTTVVGAISGLASAAVRPTVIDLVLYSCLRPDQPIDIKEVGPKTGSAAMLKALFNMGGGGAEVARELLSSALATLPATDQQKLCEAELELNSCPSHVHSYPVDKTWLKISDIPAELRLAFYSAAFSENAYTTMMQHLGGFTTLDNWDSLLQVCLAYSEDKSVPRRAPGWNLGHTILVQLLPGSLTVAPALADTSIALSRLENKDSATVNGIAQSIAAAQLAWYAATSQGQLLWAELQLAQLYSTYCSRCVIQYATLYLDSGLKTFDYEHTGFAHLIYWLEVESMALQLAGGQVGEAAMSAARSIIDTVPHSVILARVALRCADALARKSTGSLFENNTGLVSPALRATVLARGRPQAVAEIKALSGRLPPKLLPHVTTAYMVAAGSATLSMQQAADMLQQQLLQPDNQPSKADIVQLLCATGSLGPELRVFDAALVTGFKELLTAGLSPDQAKDGTPLWFAAALAQLQLVEQARDSSALADIIAGSGVEEEYLRPYAEFTAAKRATSTALAGAVCQVGWSIQSSAARAIATSSILTMGDSPSVCCRASLWALSSCIANHGCGQDSAAETSVNARRLVHAVVRTVKAAGQDDRLAVDMPASYGWLAQLASSLYMPKPSYTYTTAMHISPVLQQILSESGGSFSKLEPAMQAIVQAAATAVVACPDVRASSALVVGLLPVVPLLTAQGYSIVLDQLLTEVPAEQLPSTLPTAWSAAVAAATDLQLAATPAFGKQRPDVPFIVQELRRVWQQVASHPQLALAVLQPVISAAGKLLSQDSTAGSDASQQAAAQLLDAVCSMLASSGSSSSNNSSSSRQGQLSFADCLQLLDLILQQQDSSGVVTAGTTQCFRRSGSSKEDQQQFEALVQQHSSSPAVSVLLCSMLQTACRGQDNETTWSLFQLLQQCSQPSGGSQQQLHACSALLEQQRGRTAVCTATASDRVVAIWQHCCAAAGSSSAAIQQLGLTAQQAVVSALIAKGQYKQALLLAEESAALLPYLATLWQLRVQQERDSVDAAALLHALQICIAAGGQQAAGAADTLAGLLLQQDAAGGWQDGELPVQLLQLLCTHGKVGTALQLLPKCLAGPGSRAAAATAIAAAAVAVAQAGSTQQQAEMLQLLRTGAGVGAVQDALCQALGQPAPAAVGLLLRSLRDRNPKQGLGQLLTPGQLQQLCKLVCSIAAEHSHIDSDGSSSSSSLLTAVPSVYLFAVDCLSAEQLPGGVAGQLVNVLCRQHPELQPTAAAEHLGVGAVPARSSTEQGPADPSEGTQASVMQLVHVVADLCCSQVGRASLPNDIDALEASFAKWVSALSPEAAAAALFAAWVHRGQGRSNVAVALLCLELYQRAKSTGDNLVFDLALLAAAEAANHTGNWHRGEVIIAAAAKAQQYAEGSKGSRHCQWLPSWPAAGPALLSVLVHTKEVNTAAKLLLREHEQGVQTKQQGLAAAGNKGKTAAAASSSTRRDIVAAVPSTLLSLEAVNSFLLAVVAVAAAHQREGSDEEAESAAQAAMEVTGELFKRQLVAVSMGASGAGLPAPGTAGLLPDSISWGCLAQLYGLLGDWQQLRATVLAAARQELPGLGPNGVQVVLAGAAAALNAAGRHVAAVQLLDGLIAAGVTAISDPQLAQQLLDAADKSREVEQELANRLAAGDEAIYEGLPDVAAAGSGLGSDPVPALQLQVVYDAAEALAQLTTNLRR